MPARPRTLFSTGATAGVIGFLVTTAGFGLLDFASGRGLGFTPGVLSGALFRGIADACEAQPDAGSIAAYSALHLLVFVVLGWFSAWLVARTARQPQVWLAAVFAFLFVAFHLYGAVLTLLAPVRGCFSLYHILGATSTASAAMILYLVRRHPGLPASIAAAEREG